MEVSKKKRREAIERGKLALALLKERFSYRKFFDEYSKDAIVAYERFYLKGYRWYVEQEDWKSLMSSDLNTLGRFHRQCEEQFRFNSPFSRVSSADDILLLLDPAKDVEDIPERLEPVLAEMFSREWISQVEHEGVPLSVLMYEWPSVAMLLPKKLDSYQRLLLVDMRGSHAALEKRFAELLDSVERNRKYCPGPWVENDWQSYNAWDFDNHREREEVRRHLKVWKLRRRRKSFLEIARELRISHDNAKKSFYRAFELIERQRYDRQDFSRVYWEVRKENLRRTCATCPDRDNCQIVCPDVLPFVDQDRRALRGEITSPEVLDQTTSRESRPARSTPRKKTQ